MIAGFQPSICFLFQHGFSFQLRPDKAGPPANQGRFMSFHAVSCRASLGILVFRFLWPETKPNIFDDSSTSILVPFHPQMPTFIIGKLPSVWCILPTSCLKAGGGFLSPALVFLVKFSHWEFNPLKKLGWGGGVGLGLGFGKGVIF